VSLCEGERWRLLHQFPPVCDLRKDPFTWAFSKLFMIVKKIIFLLFLISDDKYSNGKDRIFN
jgi:hypothetical protein